MPDPQHSDVTSMHGIAQISPTDPGAIGARKGWLDSSGSSPYQLYIRNDANSGWLAAGSVAGAPTGGSYVTTAAESGLSAEVVLGTGVIMTGTYASLPAAGTAGRLYIPSDSWYDFLRDNGSSWDHFSGGILMTPPVTALATWVNQSTSTLVTNRGPMIISSPGSEGIHVHGREQAKPANTYTLTLAFYPGQWTSDAQSGIFLRDSSSGKLITYGFDSVDTTSSWRFLIQNWTSSTVISANQVILNYNEPVLSEFWLQLQNNGTNRIIRISNNRGYSWFNLNSAANSTHISANAETHCGVYVTNYNSANVSDIVALHWTATTP